MDLNGRRQSTNFEDRRGKGSVGKIAGFGGGGAIIVALIMLFLGKDPSQVIEQVSSGAMQTEQYTPSAQEEQFKTFALQILASTEDVWTPLFKQSGRTYREPKLVLFHGSVQSGCGGATSSVGPFYCSADECLYLDLDFFNEMPKSLGAGGDFAYAYVIAHEVGHHDASGTCLCAVAYYLASPDDDVCGSGEVELWVVEVLRVVIAEGAVLYGDVVRVVGSTAYGRPLVVLEGAVGNSELCSISAHAQCRCAVSR